MNNPVVFCIALMAWLFVPGAQAERPLEDPSYYEGMIAIRDMHGLNLLGVTGELIGIYNAVYAASDAIKIANDNKWRPGDDDLGWVDRQRKPSNNIPLGGLTVEDRSRMIRIMENINHLQSLIHSWSSAEKRYEISSALQVQFNHMRRIAANYSEEVLPTMQGKGGSTGFRASSSGALPTSPKICSTTDSNSARVEYILYDPVPYTGRTPVCYHNGALWFLGSRVTNKSFGSKSGGCYSNSSITTNVRTYKGELCEP